MKPYLALVRAAGALLALAAPLAASAQTAQPPPGETPAQPPPGPAPAAQPPPAQPTQPPPAQPTQPPPGYGQPYGQPPPGYGQPYGQPPPGYYPPGYYPPPGAYPQGPQGPATRAYSEGQPIPDGYVLQEKSRRGPIIAGATTLGSLYFFSALAGSVLVDEEGDGFAPLFVPVVGPFITVGTAAKEVEGAGTFMLIVDGIGQTVGAVLLVYGLAGSDKVLVRSDLATLRKPELLVGPRSASFRVHF